MRMLLSYNSVIVYFLDRNLDLDENCSWKIVKKLYVFTFQCNVTSSNVKCRSLPQKAPPSLQWPSFSHVNLQNFSTRGSETRPEFKTSIDRLQTNFGEAGYRFED